MKARLIRQELQIVSGGQTGADQAALIWAIDNEIEHGGWCPKGRKTESGVLDKRFRLKEASSPSYLQRTEWNVRDSDATVIFTMTNPLIGGSKRTVSSLDVMGGLASPFRHRSRSTSLRASCRTSVSEY